MKKTVSALLVLVMVLGLLSGCAAEPAPSQPVTEPEVNYANATVILYTGNVRGSTAIYPQIAAARAAYEAKGAQVFLVDAGNYLQGTADANSDRGLTVYNLMDAAGYDVAAMGKYEFVYGDATTGYAYHSNFTKYFTQAELYRGAEALEYQKNSPRAEEKVMATRDGKAAASFKVVCSNLTAQEDNSGFYAFEEYVVLGDSLKVGFVSAVSESVSDFIQEGYLDGYTFGAISAPACDVLVALGGGVNGADVEIPLPEGSFVAGAYVIDNTTKAVTEEPVDLSGSDDQVAALVAAVEPAKRVGTASVTLNGADSVNWNGESNLGDLTADALLWYAKTKVEGLKDVPVVAIQNGGNCDNFLYAGQITEVDLLKALPFSPMGVGIVYLTGAQLLDTLESATQRANCPGWAQVAGMTYTVDTTKPYDAGESYGDYFKAASINRVTITSVDGTDFDVDATYAVVADNFLMKGNDTYYTLKEAAAAEGGYVEISSFGGLKTRDIVARYIAEVLGGSIGAPYGTAQGRITVQ